MSFILVREQIIKLILIFVLILMLKSLNASSIWKVPEHYFFFARQEFALSIAIFNFKRKYFAPLPAILSDAVELKTSMLNVT